MMMRFLFFFTFFFKLVSQTLPRAEKGDECIRHTREILASETFSVCDDETQKRPKKKTNVKVFWRKKHITKKR